MGAVSVMAAPGILHPCSRASLQSSAMRRVLHDGQIPRPLRVKAIRKSCPHSSQRARAKPYAKSAGAGAAQAGAEIVARQRELDLEVQRKLDEEKRRPEEGLRKHVSGEQALRLRGQDHLSDFPSEKFTIYAYCSRGHSAGVDREKVSNAEIQTLTSRPRCSECGGREISISIVYTGARELHHGKGAGSKARSDRLLWRSRLPAHPLHGLRRRNGSRTR
jgi:hypothetical protein